MRVVSENSEQDLAKRSAAEQLEYGLRELAANMMRVVRGAGKPYEIAPQIFGLTGLLQDYKEAVGTWPSSYDVGQMLELGYRFEHLAARDDSEDMFHRAEHEVMRASLQFAASRLMEQRTQETRASSDMHDAMRRIEEIRAERRRQRGKPPSKENLDRERAELRAMMNRGKPSKG
jgi:hypothetical protein